MFNYSHSNSSSSSSRSNFFDSNKDIGYKKSNKLNNKDNSCPHDGCMYNATTTCLGKPNKKSKDVLHYCCGDSSHGCIEYKGTWSTLNAFIPKFKPHFFK